MSLCPFSEIHQNGESILENKQHKSELIPVDTFGGKIHVEWDPQAAVTPIGQMPFFIEFLKTSGLFDNWVENCPLTFFSNNHSKKRDILGTFLLSILSGHTRYAHITALRGDGVNPDLLGMSRVVSEDSARRAMKKIDEEQGKLWLEEHLKRSYEELLCIDWILDIDSTVKPLYGKQEGAEIGYNPTKPGRPSHNYHTYHIANIRMILDVEVEDGKSGAGCYSAPKLWQLLEKIPKGSWPVFIRGDSSYGNEGIMKDAEYRNIKYLFKLKCSVKIKQLIAKMMQRTSWVPVGQGWEGSESLISLTGWTANRRVVILRRRLSEDKLGILKKRKKSPKQLELDFCFADVQTDVSIYEYQVLVTNLDEELSTISQQYRDRSDCENNFDELKNQWGWCGYTTQDLKRCRLMAKTTALIYNWWTIFSRLANPHSHLEAVTSRPLLLNAVAKRTSHAGQTKLTVTSSHSKFDKVQKILSAIAKFFRQLKESAEQSTPKERFKTILMVAFRKFLPNKTVFGPQIEFSSG